MVRRTAAALAACVVLAGCGGGGGDAPSALDPARMIPANSLMYYSVTVRPQRAVKDNLVDAIDSIAGNGAAKHLATEIVKALHGKWGQVKGWAGQRVGIAITGLPSTAADSAAEAEYVVAVVPTNDPSAATSFLSDNAASMTKAGVTGKVVGNYAVIGGTYAVGQALATTPKTSLAATPGYTAAMAQLGSGELISWYAPMRQLFTGLLPLLKSNPLATTDPEFAAPSLAKLEHQVPAGSSVAAGIAAVHNGFRLDFVTQGMKKPNTAGAPAADIGSLPGDSWLALSVGSTADGTSLSKLAKTLPQEIASMQALSGTSAQIPNAPLSFLEHDLLPALGPMTLSVSGTSATSLHAGLLLSPLNQSAGPRLVTAAKQLLNGLPVTANAVGGRVAVTFGQGELQQLLNPSSKLADNPTFKQAIAQLPTGAKAAFYLNFAPMPMLAALGGSAPSPSTMRVLDRLNYVIAGGTHGHFRLVLATH